MGYDCDINGNIMSIMGHGIIIGCNGIALHVIYMFQLNMNDLY